MNIEEERRQHKGGRILRLEPSNTRELLASPMTINCFKHVGCFDFCEMVQRVQHHRALTRVFISNLKDNQITIVGVTFTISTDTIVVATRITNVGEKWFKAKVIDTQHYEPFLKTRYKNDKKKVFPFSHLLDIFSPMMKIIMKYFTCEGRFSRLYAYHIRLQGEIAQHPSLFVQEY